MCEMGELVTLINIKHAEMLIDGIWNLFLEDFSTDFEIFVRGNDGRQKSLKVHHMILSITFPELKNDIKKQIHFDSVNEEDVNDMMEFIYRGKVNVNEEKLEHLKTCATEAGLTVLSDLIDDYQREKLGKSATEGNNMPVKRKRKLTSAMLELYENLEKKKRRNTGKKSTKQLPPKPPPSRQRRRESTVVDQPTVETVEDDKSHPDNKSTSKPGLKRKIFKFINKVGDTDGRDAEEMLPSKVAQTRQETNRTTDRFSTRRGRCRKTTKIDNSAENNGGNDDVEIHNETDVTSPLAVAESQIELEGNAVQDINTHAKTEGENAGQDSKPESTWLKSKIIELARDKTSVREWTCELCGQVLVGFFRQLRHLQCHEKPDLKLKCSHCTFVTEVNTDLTKHLANKHQLDSKGNPITKDVIDGRVYTSKTQLNSNQTSGHVCHVQCDQCTAIFFSLVHLNYHKAVCHGNSSCSLDCPTCDFKSRSRQQFKKHLITHVENIICHVCGEPFTPSGVKAHHASHQTVTSNVELKCHLCEFVTKQPYCLKFHLKNVHKLSSNHVQQSLNDATQQGKQL